MSFASPCVFPLVPGYLSFVAGDRAEGERGLVPILLFIGGFSVVFVALFGFTDVFFQAMRGTWGRVITGGIVDSFSMVSLKRFLEKKYSISIPDDQATPEAFDTVARIITLVHRFQKGA